MSRPPRTLYIDTRSKQVLAVAICDRCKFKFPIGELSPDRNTQGLMVCREDNDEYDPYRLPPPPPDKFNLPFTRPDVPIINPYGDVPPFPVPQSNPAFPVAPTTLNVTSETPIVSGPGGPEIDL